MSKTLAVLLFAGAAAGANAGEQVYTITVQGEAVVSATPDEVAISLTAEGRSVRSLTEAVNLQAEKTAAILALLKQQGVPEKKVSTTEYWFGPVDKWEQNPQGQSRQVFSHFEARQRLRVCVARDKAPAVLGGLPQVAKVDSVSFIVSNAKQLREGAVDAAIDDAKARAAKRAAKLGVKLGAILGYSEGFQQPDQPQPQYDVRVAAGRAEAAPQLPAGEAELTVTVSVTYQLLVQ